MIAIKECPSSTPLHHSPRTHPHLSSPPFIHRRLLPAGVKWHQPDWSGLNQTRESQIPFYSSIHPPLFVFQRTVPLLLHTALLKLFKTEKRKERGGNAWFGLFCIWIKMVKANIECNIRLCAMYGRLSGSLWVCVCSLCAPCYSYLTNCTLPKSIISNYTLDRCVATPLTSEIKVPVSWSQKKSDCSSWWREAALHEGEAKEQRMHTKTHRKINWVLSDV